MTTETYKHKPITQIEYDANGNIVFPDPSFEVKLKRAQEQFAATFQRTRSAVMTETYKLNAMGGVQRLSDGAFIPEDERNADWRAYQQWVAEGNAAFAADYEPPAKTTLPGPK